MRPAKVIDVRGDVGEDPPLAMSFLAGMSNSQSIC